MQVRTCVAALTWAALGASLFGCSSSSSGTSLVDGSAGGSSNDGMQQAGGQCRWPAGLYDGGPGSCTVGRAYVKCEYPSGVVCDGGPSAYSPGGLTMLCISNDPTRCEGCGPDMGMATCSNQCASNQYALSCGGPPPFPAQDGGAAFTYQGAPATCVGVGVTPGGNGYYCCPCE